MLAAKEGKLPIELERIRQDLSSGSSIFYPLLECSLTNDAWRLKTPILWKQEYAQKMKFSKWQQN